MRTIRIAVFRRARHHFVWSLVEFGEVLATGRGRTKADAISKASAKRKEFTPMSYAL